MFGSWLASWLDGGRDGMEFLYMPWWNYYRQHCRAQHSTQYNDKKAELQEEEEEEKEEKEKERELYRPI